MSISALARRLLTTAPGVVLLLGLVIALLAAVGTAAPGVSTELANRQLAHTLGSLSPAQGDLRGSWVTTGQEARAENSWSGLTEDAERVRGQQPEPLRGLLAPAQFVSSATQPIAFAPPEETGYFRASLNVSVDPALEDHVTLVRGDWPGPVPPLGAGEPLPVVVLEETALRMSWGPGQSLPGGLVVAGTYRVDDPLDPRWEYMPTAARRGEKSDPNRGIEVVLTVFTTPAAPPGVGTGPGWTLPMRVQLWYRLDADRVGSQRIDLELLSQELTGLLARRSPIGTQQLRLASDLGKPLTNVLAEQSMTSSLLAVFTVGVLLMGVALALLAARLVHQRHRTTFTLLHARGASRPQLRRLLGVAGVAVAVPAALFGQLAVLWLLPGTPPPWIPAVGVAAAALGVLALTATPPAPYRSRDEVTPASGRARLVGEAVVALLTGVSVWLLLGRADAGATAGPDPFVAAAPALLSLLGTMAVLRLLPVPLHALARTLGRRRGLAAFLGVLRSLRSPAGGPLPVGVMVLGACLTVTSATLQGTLAHGVTSAAWLDNGAAVRLSGPRITDDLARSLAGIDGVTTVAQLHSQGATTLRTAGGDTVRVDLWLADEALREAWSASPVAPPVVPSLFDTGGTPSLVVGGVPADVAGDVTLGSLGAAEVGARWDVLPGVNTGPAWALGNVADFPPDLVSPPTLALIGTGGETSPDVVRGAVEGLIRSGLVTTVDDRLATAQDSPTVAGLARITVALTALTGVFMVGALVLGQVAGSSERRRAVSRLHTMGLSPAQARWMTAWELGPVAAVAIVGGSLLGTGVAALVVGNVDLRIVTGGSHQPSLFLDPGLVGAVVAALAATLALTIGVGARVASRGDLAAPEGGDL